MTTHRHGHASKDNRLDVTGRTGYLDSKYDTSGDPLPPEPTCADSVAPLSYHDRCPYCGTALELEDDGDAENGPHLSAWCPNDNCPGDPEGPPASYYEDAEDADSELVGNPPEDNPPTVTPTHGASPGSTEPAAWVVDKGCHRCGVEVPPSHLTGKRLVYDIPALSERHLCADCVLDLMRTDPTCKSVMKYIERKSAD